MFYLSERFASCSYASASGLYSRPTARPNESGTKNYALIECSNLLSFARGRAHAGEASGCTEQVQERRALAAGGDGRGLARPRHPARGRGDQPGRAADGQVVRAPRRAHGARGPLRARPYARHAVRRGALPAHRVHARPQAAALRLRRALRTRAPGARARGAAHRALCAFLTSTRI